MQSILSVMFFLISCTCAVAQAYLYSDTAYQVSKNKSEVLTIQNSLPKGGGYTDPSGKRFGYVVFWTHVSNNTSAPIELTINFPADSLTTFLRPGFVFKIFLPTDTMRLDKEGLYDFGAKGLKALLDAGLKKPTRLQKTLNPKEETFFYIGMLIHAMPPNNGALRTGLVLRGKELFYRLSMTGEVGSALIPCGKIVLKN